MQEILEVLIIALTHTFRGKGYLRSQSVTIARLNTSKVSYHYTKFMGQLQTP